jgi:hypothetical protein
MENEEIKKLELTHNRGGGTINFPYVRIDERKAEAEVNYERNRNKNKIKWEKGFE